MAKNIKIAYLISCYKLPDQVVRLAKTLSRSGTTILIHIDKKSTNNYVEHIKKGLNDLDNVVYLRRHKCYWGDFGHVRATIKAINYLFNNQIDFDYFFVLTGQDYPIKSSEYINKFLADIACSYMDFFALPNKMWSDGMDRVEKLHINIRGKHYIVPGKPSKLIIQLLPKVSLFNKSGFSFYGGSSYFTLSRKHAKYVYDYLKFNPGYINFFKHTYISDEIFFQTLLLNSEYKQEIVNNNLRLIDWSGPDEYPTIFKANDFAKLRHSKALFARKFDTTKDSKVLDMIDNGVLVTNTPYKVN